MPATGTVQVNVKSLMDAGAHFGHQTERWNPRMMPYIYGERNNVHIINLDLTLKCWDKARKFIVDRVSRGGEILFVGTKQQAREIVAEEARRCGAFFVNTRWLGGTLSNFQTIKNSIDRMRKMETLLAQAEDENSDVKLNKKEKLNISRQVGKLEANLGGIRGMKRQPDLIFVIDVNKEWISVAEARRLHIPVVAIIDTNVDPKPVDFPIPSNDDATRAIKLIAAAVADAVLEGKQAYDAMGSKDRGDRDQHDSSRVGRDAGSDSGMAAASH
jgi:small subunit ribosomal protein S2